MTKATISVLGIDLGKNTCSIAGLDTTGAVVLRRKVTRDALIAFAATLPPCTIAMEACCGAHFLGRTFTGNGHTVRLMSPANPVANVLTTPAGVTLITAVLAVVAA